LVHQLLEREKEFGNEFDAIDEYDTTYFCDGYCYEVSFDPAELCGFGLAYLSGCLPHHFCLVFTYDASSRESWDETVAAYENIRSRCENGVLPFVGTMIAAMGDGPVSHEEAETFASERDCLFAKYSPVTGRGICDAVGSLVEQAHRARHQYATDPNDFRSGGPQSAAYYNRTQKRAEAIHALFAEASTSTSVSG
jgi:hypothetical protein